MTTYFALAAAVAVLAGLHRFMQHCIVESHHKMWPQRPRIDNPRWTFVDFLIMAVLVGFSALRYQVGNDYTLYSAIYERSARANGLPWLLQATPQDIGFTVMSYYLGFISHDPKLLFAVSAVLTVVPAYVALKRLTDQTFLGVMFYILLTSYVAPFNIVRQGIAISFVFLATTYLDRGKGGKWWFLLLCALASIFHATALLAAPIIYVARNVKLTPARVTVTLSLSVAASAAFGTVGNVLTPAFSLLNSRYDTYIAQAALAGIGTYMMISAKIGLIVWTMWNRRDADQRWIVYVLIGVVFLILGTQSVVVARMEVYFGIFYVVLLAQQLGRMKVFVPRVVVLAAAGVYFGFYLSQYGALLPYQSYL